MPIDRFRAMDVFAHVVQLGSFTRAAEALKLPKARVSTLVQELEAHLGVKLLHRTTRRLHLTDDGSAYHQRAVTLLQEMHDLEGDVTRAVRSPAGRLRVDVPAAVGRHVIGPALPEFFRRHPQMALELGSSDRPVDLIAEGVDCVIRGGLVHDETLVARPLGSLPVVTCAAPSYLASMGRPETLPDLDRHMFVNFFSAKTGRVFPFDFDDGSGMQHISRPHWVCANDADTYVAAGVAGMGLMQIPRSRVVREHLAAGRLLPVLPAWDAGRLALNILYPRNRHLSARVRAFVDWVLALYGREFAEVAGADARAGAFFEQGGAALRGHDTVAYFKDGKPIKGAAEHKAECKGSTFLFASKANRDAFAAEPAKYAPQYGGYCAFGVAGGYKAAIDPAAFTVVEGKLYLNYNRGVHTQWSGDIPGFIAKAEKNWPAVSGQSTVHE